MDETRETDDMSDDECELNEKEFIRMKQEMKVWRPCSKSWQKIFPMEKAVQVFQVPLKKELCNKLALFPNEAAWPSSRKLSSVAEE